MRLALVTPPAEEPVSLAEAKLFLRVTHDEEDALIGGLIAAARQHCETQVSRSFVATVWDLFLDEWPWWDRYSARSIGLPRADVISVDEVAYVDSAGATITLDPSAYQPVTGTPARVVPAYGYCWPVLRCQPEAVRVRFTAGYGETAADVPLAVRQAVLMMTAFLYENRGDLNAEAPAAVAMLLASADWGAYS